MAIREITFSPEKALESLLYIAARVAEPTIHEVLKIRYFADKLHLAEYGFLASGDDYVAMKFGPVASNTYNLLKAARGDQSGWTHPIFADLVKDSIAVKADRKLLVTLRAANLTRLSRADVDCLDQAIQQYGNMQFGERTKLSHDATWQNAWDAATEDEVGASPMHIEAIARTLPNAHDLIEYLRA